jgi:hypothetical protein
MIACTVVTSERDDPARAFSQVGRATRCWSIRIPRELYELEALATRGTPLSISIPRDYYSTYA